MLNCVICSKEILSKTRRKTCSKECHSETIRRQLNENPNYKKFKDTQGKEGWINSASFNKSFLERAKIDTTGLDDEEILLEVNRLKSEQRKSKEYKLRCVRSFLTKRKDNILVEELIKSIGDIDQLDSEQLDSLYKSVNSLKSILAMRKNPYMGSSKNWKRRRHSSFKYNLDFQEDITTRSGWESYMVEFFEENHIWWSYEKIIIKTGEHTFHIPDFMVLINNERIVLEIKGSFYRTTCEEYFKNKIYPTILEGYDYVLLMKLPKNLIDFKKMLQDGRNFVKKLRSEHENKKDNCVKK